MTKLLPTTVLEWRHDSFAKLGFEEHVANYLAATKIDISEMTKLLKNDCTHELAIRILLGTMFSGEDVEWESDEDANAGQACQEVAPLGAPLNAVLRGPLKPVENVASQLRRQSRPVEVVGGIVGHP